MHFTLGHSPDPDDAFMFYALATGQINVGGHTFEHVLQDIQTLNERASRAELDITAFSIHAYASFTEHYVLTPCGASMGDGYGPRLVGKRPCGRAELRRRRIAIPGRQTSAALALQLYLERGLEELEVVVAPFDTLFEVLRREEADYALLIHEGQLTFGREELQLVEDLGRWWKEETGGLPLPLGGNGIRRSLGGELHRELNGILKESIAYSLEPAHRRQAVEHALQYGRGLDLALADEFVGMYVNELTLDYGTRGRAAIREFLRRGAELGVVPREVQIDFVE